MRRYAVAVGCVALLVLAAGCAMERRITSLPVPPWVTQPTDEDEQYLYFRGLSVVETTLQQRQAQQQAVADAVFYIANAIAGNLEGKVIILDDQEGAVHKEETRDAGKASASVILKTSEVAHQAMLKENYEDKWEVRRHCLGKKLTRIKYYVWVRYPKEEYQRKLEEVKKGLKVRELQEAE